MEHKEDLKTVEETAEEEEEVPVPFVINVNNMFHSFFSEVEV